MYLVWFCVALHCNMLLITLSIPLHSPQFCLCTPTMHSIIHHVVSLFYNKGEKDNLNINNV